MRMVPSTLVSYIVCHFCSSALATGSSPRAPPALLTSSRQGPTAPQNASTDARSVTSRGKARASDPSCDASASRRSTRRAPMTTSNPAATSASAVAAPMPLEAPVTTAVPLLSMTGSGY